MNSKASSPLAKADFYLTEMRAGRFESDAGDIVYPNQLEMEIEAFPLGREAALAVLGAKEEDLRALDLLYLISNAQDSLARMAQALHENRPQEAYTAFQAVKHFAEGGLFGMKTSEALSLIGVELKSYEQMKESFTFVRHALTKSGKKSFNKYH